MSKKLEIIFPIYKDHKMFTRALEALVNQTFQDFSVVIMDDTSPIGYEEIVSSFSDRLDIEIKTNPKNLGAMQNMWQSIQFPTSSPYIFSHHADDFIKADYLERAIAILDTNPEVSYVLTNPEWVHADTAYVNKKIGVSDYITFDAADFAKNILNFAPYMFGSVIYRTSHRISDWQFDRFHVFCDRYFLGSILSTHNSHGAFLKGAGIFERDHALDSEDKRSDGATEDHAIKLLAFYRDLLMKKYPSSLVEKIITNNSLYYYSNFDHRSPLNVFLKKQRPYNLVQLKSIRLLGLFGLVTLPLSQKGKRKIIQTSKSFLSIFK